MNYFYRSRSVLLCICSAFFLLLCPYSGVVVSDDAFLKTPADETIRIEDVDKSIDKAIKVLTVIREELKEEEKLPAADLDSASKEESRAITAARWIARINRMWRSVKKAASDDADDTKDIPEPDVIDTKEISGRIGQAIDMMTAIKKELEKETPAEDIDGKEQNGT